MRWLGLENLNSETLSQYQRYHRKHPKRSFCTDTIGRHRRWGYTVEITPKELYEKIKDVEKCPICGRQIDWTYGNKGGFPNISSPSLDIIDPKGTVNLNNVQILCFLCNTAKGNRPMGEFITNYREYIKQAYKNIYGKGVKQ